MQKFHMMMAIGVALQLTTQGAPIATPVSGICNTPHCLQTASNILKDMQASADPCIDFSQFACGGFNEREKLGPGEKKNGYLVSIDQQNIEVIRSIVTPNDPKGPVIAKNDTTSQRNLKKLHSYYGACMDNNQLAKVGRKPLQDEIRKLTQLFPVTNTVTTPNNNNGIRTVLSPANRQALSKLWGYNMKHGFETPIAWDLWDDETNPGYKMLTAQQSGLGLKDEALYKDEKIVKLYEKVVGEMFYIIQGKGKPQSAVPKNWQQVGKDVVAFEMILAGVETKPKAAAETAVPKKERAIDSGAETGTGAEEEETGDGEGGDGDDEDEDDDTIVWDKISDLDEATPSLDWTVIFKNALPADVPLPENINMLWKFYFRRLETALETMSLQTVQNYFSWTLMRNLGGNLAEPLQRPLAELKRALPGEAATSTRWRNCVQLVNENLGDLAGHFFVKATFPEESQAIMNEMIGSLRWSFEKSFWNYDWLDPRTLQAALQKLKAIVPKVGFSTSSPNVGQSASVDEYYRPLVIKDKDHFGNQVRASTWKQETMFRGMTKPANRVKLASIPQTVNAFYNPNMNSIEILAGILRAPFFDAAVPEYLNYAGIGVVAAHELGHAFDNSGRRYDETGAIREWWEESSIQEFDTRSQCFIEQYNEYTIDGPDGKKHNVNGWGTLGENIADNGGLKIAYDAWAQRRGNDKHNNKKLPGLERYTSEQLFFIQYARAHCGNMTPEESVKMLNDDNHSPKKWRINGVVQNSDHFAKAFQCKAGAPMNPTKKCVLL
ncbi:Endothelin-converting enzyme 2 [Linnemannia elongata]|nr:Endothelin-converting enzyme 2 [Linnemannia elongata]